jgi:hypothetical protein
MVYVPPPADVVCDWHSWVAACAPADPLMITPAAIRPEAARPAALDFHDTARVSLHGIRVDTGTFGR